ncbi:MAG TPA: serine hydrolase domain-containing protein [Streptosporangiaceae bacterium]|nr:serine hydrolase domain-containing protein [Streptosporangiaceae bacterium]
MTTAGLDHLHAVMADHVSAGDVPGMVLGLSRGRDVHIEAIGTLAVGGTEPVHRDTLFRITSMTRPVTAVATLQLVEEGKLALDEPIDRLLPELAGRRVLRELKGPVADTVAAERPVTVRDLLTFRAGFGMILAPPSEYPILQAEQALELRSVGPPTPVTPYDPDEWIRRLGTLPLMDQPGRQWRYNTGSQILGVLIARASGQPAESFYRERIFEPLGMKDTGFLVPPGELGRLAPCYQEADGALVPYDDDGAWSHPRVFNDCGAGLVSTVPDYLAFGQMLLAGGTHGGQMILRTDLVEDMTSDQLTAEQRESADVILGDRGWGFGLSVLYPPENSARGPKGYGWHGGFGTAWINDPDADLVAVVCAQVLGSPVESAVTADFWSATYNALGG